jgi:hypothetical protein
MPTAMPQMTLNNGWPRVGARATLAAAPASIPIKPLLRNRFIAFTVATLTARMKDAALLLRRNQINN